MNQYTYDLIVASIKYGMPALAPELIQALNKVVEDSRKLIEKKGVENANTK